MLILASQSKGRIFILEKAGIIPDEIIPADIDETVLKNEPAHLYVQRLAKEKAEKVAKDNPNAYIIGADTIICVGKRILGKPTDEAHEREMLNLLSGRKVKALTGHCVIAPNGENSVKLAKTIISFKRLSSEEIEEYIKAGEWKGCSGGFRILALASKFIKGINGTHANVCGICAHTTNNMLKGLGYNGK